jgi:hypothetical protein
MFSSVRAGSHRAKSGRCVTSRRTWLNEKEVDAIGFLGLADVKAVRAVNAINTFTR